MTTEIKNQLKKTGWIFDEDEDTCVAFVKGDYDLWYYPVDMYLIIEDSEKIYFADNLKSQEEIIEIVKNL